MSRSSDPSRRRRSVLAATAASLLPWRAGADDRAGPHAHAFTAAGKDVLTVVGPWEMTGLDPSRAGYMFARMEVVETLLDVSNRGRLQPRLATSWQVSNDGLTWRFRLRGNRRFHDGSEITPENVLMCLRRAHARPGVLRLADIRAMSSDVELLRHRDRDDLERPAADDAHHLALRIERSRRQNLHREVREQVGQRREGPVQRDHDVAAVA
jgi:peptide/nickel transport system substrate-binding protein